MEFMRLALEEALKALEEDEVPIGAVIVKDDRVIARAHNQRMARTDATSHAEIEAIRRACKALGDWRLTGCTMYVTLEPCSMCAGAIAQSRLDAVIFGAWDDEQGCCGSKLNIPGDRRAGGRAKVAGGVMEDECGEVVRRYFEGRRTVLK